jgi:hypothetical protein
LILIVNVLVDDVPFSSTTLARIALQATGSVTVQAVVLVATVSFLITCEVTEALGRVDSTVAQDPEVLTCVTYEFEFILNSNSVSVKGDTKATAVFCTPKALGYVVDAI